MPRLLALDLSTNTGWALLERGEPPRFGTVKLPPAIGDDQGGRFKHLIEWLDGMQSLTGFDSLAYERPILPRKSGDLATTMETLTLLWGLCTIVQLYAHQNGLPCKPCPVEQAKITLTGSKHAKKEDMVRAAMGTMNWKVSNDHEADAGAVGLWAFEQLWPKRVAA
jgi:Holliday junction resolvasome RuvABC endonuclease subunit